jgi:clan AA aspartic protease
MGAIRARFKLINAVDQARAQDGQIEPQQVRSYEADALVDTGAVRSVIPLQVVQYLGLRIRDQRVAEYADGRREQVGLAGPIIFEWQGQDTDDDALVLGDEVLIGQTVLDKLDLLADCKNGRLIPNPAHPDGPVNIVK